MGFSSSSTNFPATTNLSKPSGLETQNDFGKSIMSAAQLSDSMDIDSEQKWFEMAQKTKEISKKQDDFDDDK